jgi:hypothetical protein
LTKIGLAMYTRAITKMIPKRAFLSINSAPLCRQILINLYPSSGAIGIRLKIARAIFKKLKLIQKLIIGSQLLRKISFGVPPITFAYINRTNIHIIAKTKFVAGHANATISSPLRGDL